MDVVRRARKSEDVIIDIAAFSNGISRMANGRGLGSDFTEGALLKNAPASALLDYRDIVNSIVSEVAWPVQSRWVSSRLIPKASGGGEGNWCDPFPLRRGRVLLQRGSGALAL